MVTKDISVLIIDDSVEIIKILTEILKPYYKVFFSTNGNSGFRLAKKQIPDIILLDIMMEPIDGYEVCRKLKENESTKDIPVIFVTAATDVTDEAKGFEIGCVDYIRKPFVPVVALARIKHQAQRALYLKELQRLYSLALDANPITHLPGNNSIHNHIDSLLANKIDHYILYCDLDNFKSYNDRYGFAKGDEVIHATAKLFEDVANELNITGSFFGHVGGDDFIITIDSLLAEEYIKKYLSEFDKMVLQFYTKEDKDIGFIVSKNRFGDTVKFPIISISISGVDLSVGSYKSYLQISDICSDLKSKVKKTEGSVFMLDQRSKRWTAK